MHIMLATHVEHSNLKGAAETSRTATSQQQHSGLLRVFTLVVLCSCWQGAMLEQAGSDEPGAGAASHMQEHRIR